MSIIETPKFVRIPDPEELKKIVKLAIVPGQETEYILFSGGTFLSHSHHLQKLEGYESLLEYGKYWLEKLKKTSIYGLEFSVLTDEEMLKKGYYTIQHGPLEVSPVSVLFNPEKQCDEPKMTSIIMGITSGHMRNIDTEKLSIIDQGVL